MQKYLMTAASGRQVWVPEDKLEEWQKAQADQSPEAKQAREQLKEAILEKMQQLSAAARENTEGLQLDDIKKDLEHEKIILSVELHEEHKKLEKSKLELKEANTKLSVLREENDHLNRISTRKTFIFLLLLAILLIFIFVNSNRRYDDGYSAGYSAGEEDGYDKGYSERTKSHTSSASNAGTHKSNSSTNTGTGSSRQSAISDDYIGNKKTKKYHRSTCSFLPDQSNQVVFDSTLDAELSGYESCNHCNP